MSKQKKLKSLKPYDLSIIQVCPVCDKVDVYKDDGHDCLLSAQNQKSLEYYD